MLSNGFYLAMVLFLNGYQTAFYPTQIRCTFPPDKRSAHAA
jgi:hypothetical protein